MTPERWKRLRAVIEAAYEEPPQNRDAVLEDACSDDPTLLSDARAILRAAENTGGFLDAPPTHTGAGDTAETRPPLEGTTLGHYRLEEQLGVGGMGAVYRARDLALGRQAAVKVLPRRVVRGLRERLRREADAVARLQHPAIATFYETGEDQGEVFLAMEYVRGETLRSRLKSGALPLEEALPLASCILGALGHAHAAGLLHRDIKPANVMVTGPRSAKLLDFGIARRLVAAGATPTQTELTSDTAVPGTMGYMSPEQILGESLDARSDLFQAGIVLYEALTGTTAFGGSSPHERLAAALTRDVDLSILVSRDLPIGICPIIARALARNRERRYPTATAFMRDLAALQEDRVETELPSILAVTQFENLSRDPEADWIGSGIAETLSLDLARVSGLEVVPRPRVSRALAALSSAHPDSPSRDLELGFALGCGWVLSGAYQKAGSALRITSRLIEVSTGRLVASEKVDGSLEAIFDLQDRLGRAVVASLSLETPAPRPQQPPDVRAYELFTRASALMTQMRPEPFHQAVELLEDAIRLAPAYAPAHAALANAHAFRSIATTDLADLERAEKHADDAIALDPMNAAAIKWKSYALWRRGLLEDAEPVLRLAVELNPNDAQVHTLRGTALLFAGAGQEALPYLQRAVELEPLFCFGWLGLGYGHLSLMNLTEAQYAFMRCVYLERDPQAILATAGGAGYVAEALRIEGRLDEARQRALEGVETAEASDNAYRDTLRAYGLCVLGRTALQQGDLVAARAAYTQALGQLRGRGRFRGSGHLTVQALAGLGRAGDAQAFEEAVRLFETRQTGSFEPFYGCQPDRDLLELARAAQALGRTAEAEARLASARAAGCLEPFEL